MNLWNTIPLKNRLVVFFKNTNFLQLLKEWIKFVLYLSILKDWSDIFAKLQKQNPIFLLSFSSLRTKTTKTSRCFAYTAYIAMHNLSLLLYCRIVLTKCIFCFHILLWHNYIQYSNFKMANYFTLKKIIMGKGFYQITIYFWLKNSAEWILFFIGSVVIIIHFVCRSIRFQKLDLEAGE